MVTQQHTIVSFDVLAFVYPLETPINQLETATDPLELNHYTPIDPVESPTDILYDPINPIQNHTNLYIGEHFLAH